MINGQPIFVFEWWKRNCTASAVTEYVCVFVCDQYKYVFAAGVPFAMCQAHKKKNAPPTAIINVVSGMHI